MRGRPVQAAWIAAWAEGGEERERERETQRGKVMEAHCGKGDPPRDWEHFLVAKIKTKLQTVLYLQDATGEGREILPETESRGGGEGGPGKGEEKGRRGSGTRKEGAMRGPGRKGKDDGKWGDGRRVLGGLGRVVGRGRARKVIEQATEGMPGMASRGDSL